MKSSLKNFLIALSLMSFASLPLALAEQDAKLALLPGEGAGSSGGGDQFYFEVSNAYDWALSALEVFTAHEGLAIAESFEGYSYDLLAFLTHHRSLIGRSPLKIVPKEELQIVSDGADCLYDDARTYFFPGAPIFINEEVERRSLSKSALTGLLLHELCHQLKMGITEETDSVCDRFATAVLEAAAARSNRIRNNLLLTTGQRSRAQYLVVEKIILPQFYAQYPQWAADEDQGFTSNDNGIRTNPLLSSAGDAAIDEQAQWLDDYIVGELALSPLVEVSRSKRLRILTVIMNQRLNKQARLAQFLASTYR